MLKYKVSAKTKQQNPIYNRQAFAASILRLLHWVYEKMLNYKNKHKDLVEAWYSLEQYIGLKEDKLSSTTVDFIRSEGNLETKCLYWFRKPKMLKVLKLEVIKSLRSIKKC